MTNNHIASQQQAQNPIVKIVNGQPVADSRDVAAYFEKEHKNVLRDIDALISQASEARLNFEPSTYKDSTGRTLRRFDMDRDGFTLLAMGFTGAKALQFKMSYIAAFNAMEAELRARPALDPMQVLNDPSAMRGLLLTYSEKVLELQAAVESQRGDVEALDRIARADGSLCITDAAKALQMRPKDLFDYLKAHGWIYRRTGSDHWVGYQTRVNAGDLEHKVTTVLRADGSEKATEQVRVTSQGIAKLAKLVSRAASAA